jgi:hypothetical protein
VPVRGLIIDKKRLTINSIDGGVTQDISGRASESNEKISPQTP